MPHKLQFQNVTMTFIRSKAGNVRFVANWRTVPSSGETHLKKPIRTHKETHGGGGGSRDRQRNIAESSSSLRWQGVQVGRTHCAQKCNQAWHNATTWIPEVEENLFFGSTWRREHRPCREVWMVRPVVWVGKFSAAKVFPPRCCSLEFCCQLISFLPLLDVIARQKYPDLFV